GNPHQALKDKGVIDSGCSRHMTGNVSFLSDFKEINGGYVAFRENPKGGKITSKGNQPNHNAGIKENLDAGKVGHETISTQQYNENEVYVSPSSSDKPKKHDKKAKRADKGKSHVDLSTRVRDLRDEFKEFYFNSTNRVNAASAPVTTAGPNSSNSTNSFNTASPSDNATVVATSSTEAKYVAAGSCCAQVLWIQNQLLDYGEELASPKQTALGKDKSNPLMVGSFPKTKW
nr:ribonuclease H-like domain-containing protein [Tanacetum cinerariifolium]